MGRKAETFSSRTFFVTKYEKCTGNDFRVFVIIFYFVPGEGSEQPYFFATIYALKQLVFAEFAQHTYLVGTTAQTLFDFCLSPHTVIHNMQ